MSELGQELIKMVTLIAEHRPDYIYVAGHDGSSSCKYFYHGAPSCLLGHALSRLGLLDAEIEHRYNDHDERLNYEPIGALLWHLTNDEGVPLRELLDNDEVEWLYQAQRTQDMGLPWGEVVASADLNARYQRKIAVDEELAGMITVSTE